MLGGDIMTIGERIKLKRESLNLSQEELAKRLGYKSRSSINKIELGKSDITQHKVVAFANALHTTTAYLMGIGDGTPEAKTNDIISDIFVRLRRDPDFLDLTSTLYSLPAEKLPAVKTVLEAFKP